MRSQLGIWHARCWGRRDAIKRLKEIDADVKAVVASGYSNDPIITNFGEYGFCGAITKPFTIDQLGKAVRDVLGD